MSTDFDKMGKQMPFTVPEGFFDTMALNIGNAVDKAERKQQRTTIIKWVMGAAAAAAVAVTTLIALKPATPIDQQLISSNEVNDSIELYMTDEDLDTWVAINNSDEFLYCDNITETNY